MKKLFLFAAFILLVGCVSVETDYNGDWNVPTVSHASMDNRYCLFGSIGYRDRVFSDDTLQYPPIPGLIHRSVFTLCPVDNCYAEYLTMALRCPQQKQLQEWLNEKVYSFVANRPLPSEVCYTDNIKWRQCPTTGEILNYYLDELERVQSHWHCSGLNEFERINEQTGLLIADCWKSGRYYTFYEATWYDMLSCGDHIKESYRTVDARTGKELKLNDFVDESNYEKLYWIVMKYLVKWNDTRWIDQKSNPQDYDSSILPLANGCGLIREGFIIYYHPYNIGCGADGEYKAVIPYSELRGLLKIKVKK